MNMPQQAGFYWLQKSDTSPPEAVEVTDCWAEYCDFVPVPGEPLPDWAEPESRFHIGVCGSDWTWREAEFNQKYPQSRWSEKLTCPW